jgi:hypothetical protein
MSETIITMITPPCLTHCSQPALYTLAPLVALGADALAPDPALGIKSVVLQELGIGWENVFQEVIVRRASDVFACAAAAGSWHDPLPPGARLVCAVLRFHVTGAGQPYLAEIWPPHILTLTPAYAAEPIKSWLAAHGFALAGSVGGFLAPCQPRDPAPPTKPMQLM